jgi:hypothetical protein
MRTERWALTLSVAASVLGLGLSGDAPDARTRLTKPTPVVLDFHKRTVAQIVSAIENRTGKRVAAHPGMTKTAFPFGDPPDLSWRDRSVTLESPRPVPFWEAMDRLAVASKLAYRLGDYGDSTGVVFEGDGEAPAPACYGGPFRVGLVAVHEYRENIFIRGPWVKFTPSNFPIPADGADLSEAPKDGGPLYVELEIAAEPGLVCRRNGHLRDVEAVDESGKPLAAPLHEEARQSVQAFAAIDGAIAPIVRVPLRRASGGSSKSIKALRGVIPVEIGALKPEPSVIIKVGDTEGKTFRGGGAVFTVKADRTEANGRIKLAFTCKLIEEVDSAVREARLANLRSFQLRIVDDRGMAVHSSSGSSGGDGQGTLSFSYEYDPRLRLSGPPAKVLFYDLDRIAWQVPFEFHDIPLP